MMMMMIAIVVDWTANNITIHYWATYTNIL
jgi:hypothetical protein